MAKSNKKGLKKQKAEVAPSSLKGWQEIAKFLGQPVNVAQRWAKTGMPVTRQGRYVAATPDELNRWLGRESSGEPLHVATPEADLSAELKRGLAYVRSERRSVQAQKKRPNR